MEVLDLVAEIHRNRNQLGLPRSAPSAPPAATKKSVSSVAGPSSVPGVWTNMKPPAPNPVKGLSVMNEVSTAQTAASTAFPPSRSTCAPASAVTGWPAATTPRAALTRPD